MENYFRAIGLQLDEESEFGTEARRLALNEYR